MCNWYATRDDDFVSPIVKGMARANPDKVRKQHHFTDEEIRDLWACT
jgi:hypothetical protein